jgi:hypothetical protein
MSENKSYPSIKGTSLNTFLTTSIRSSECIAVHIDIRFIIIVQKQKPYSLKPSARLRRRMALYLQDQIDSTKRKVKLKINDFYNFYFYFISKKSFISQRKAV